MTRTRSQNGKRSRTKGGNWERECAIRFRAVYPEAERNIAQTRTAIREGCDIEGTMWWIEAKVGGRIDLTAALRQAARDRGSDPRPILIVAKPDRRTPVVYGRLMSIAEACGATPTDCPAYVTMALDSFLIEVSAARTKGKP